MKLSFRKFGIVGAVAGLALFGQSAAAQGSGFYVEGTVGFSKMKLGDTGSLSVDNKDTNWGGVVGYMFNDYIGVEGGYRDLGKATATGSASGTVYGKAFTATGLNYSAQADGWMVGPRLNFPVHDKLSINARAGWYRWKAEESLSFTTLTYNGTVYGGNSTSLTTKETDAYYGVGAKYNLTKQVGVGLGYMHFKLNSTKIDNWDVNVSYRF